MSTNIESHGITDIVRLTKANTHVNRITSVDAFPDHPRFSAKVSVTGDCWEWQGARNSRGYGCLGFAKTPWLAHRFAYTIAVGPIPVGYQIDHLCRNIVCVRPAHLEAVPAFINNWRSESPSAINARRSECVHGHRLTPETFRVRPDGKRTCRPCNATAQKAYRVRLRGKVGASAFDSTT